MGGKDAERARAGKSRAKTALTIVVGILVLIACGWGIRQIWGPSEATAQAPPATRRVTDRAGTVRATETGAPRATTPRASNPPKSPSQVMAVVNAERITRGELGQACVRRYGKEVLETIVNRQLIAQECRRRGVAISEQDVDKEIAETAARFGLATEQWMKMLMEERDVDPRQYRHEIVWPTLALRRLATEQIEVTDEEIRQALEAEYGERVQALAISVSQKPGRTGQPTAEQIRALAAKPDADFAQLARKYSEDSTSASVGGVIPPIRRHVGRQEVEQAAFALRVGEVSQLIPYGNQYLILKCERRIPATTLSAKQQADVVARLREQIRDNKLRTTAGELFKNLQDAASIVNVLKDEQLKQQYPGVAALVNGHRYMLTSLADECVDRHGREVLEGEINRRLLLQELRKKNVNIQQADLDAEIRRAAVAYGFERNGTVEIEAWIKSVTEEVGVPLDLYVEDTVWPSVALKKLVNHQVSVSPEDIKMAFESNYGERVEVLAIVLGSQRLATQVWEMARGNPTDQFFGDLANQYSIEPVSKANFGKVPPVRRNSGQPELEKAAFRMKPGELSGIITIGDKSILLRCLGRTQPVVETMDEEIRKALRTDIEEKKLRVAMSREFQRIHEASKVTNFLSGESHGPSSSATAPAARTPSDTRTR